MGDADGMVVLPVLSGPAKYLKFSLDLVRRREAYFWGKYDRHILEQITSIVKPGWCIWDCGTYLGYYTRFFARAVRPEGAVVAIEPDPRNLKRTLHNCKLNGLSNIFPANLAIGLPLGEVEFLLSDDSNSHLPGYYVGSAEAQRQWHQRDQSLPRVLVRSVSFDSACYVEGLPRPDLIKIDIEGAEKDALLHAARLFREVRPILVLELHNPEADAVAWRFANEFGYHMDSMKTGIRVRSRREAEGTLLCVPKP